MEKEIPLPTERIKEVFQNLVDHLSDFRRLPVSTYRLQFNHRFTFSQAQKVIPYLHELGISDIYSSPYFLAKKGSLHGYDIMDPNQINPEIGTVEDYQEWNEELGKYKMGQLLDIVPNHMGITGNQNTWWMDVLENGPSSLYADFFDIDWRPAKEELADRVLLPILGEQYGHALENQDLSLKFEEGSFFIQYGEQKFPLDPSSYTPILKFRLDGLTEKMEAVHPDLNELLSIITALEHLPAQNEKNQEKILERRREKEIIKKRILSLSDRNDSIRTYIHENVRAFNGEKGKEESFDLLDELLNAQSYRLSYWRVATEEINYRRFFDINELAALRTETLPVFQEVHKLIFKLVREKKITGLRVDHPDGLYNPVEYFYRLQKGCFTQIGLQAVKEEGGENNLAALDDEIILEELGRLYDKALSDNKSSSLQVPFYIIGEKILTKNERMPEDWPIWGTVGYVFLNPVNGLFIDTENAKAFEGIYSRFIRAKINYPDLVYEKKKLIMETSLSGEMNTLGHHLNRLSEKDRHTRDFTLNSLRTAIMEVIACLPIYRTYANYCEVNERDRRYIEQAVAKAKRKNPAFSSHIFDFLENILLLQYPEDFNETEKMNWLEFAMRFQQASGPVMAKGVEDTVFYVFNRLVSLNDVGGNPDKFGTPLEAFHGQNIERTKFWPYGLITTTTHDTKRSEDVRARINVLSELPDEWRKCLIRWSRMNKKKKSQIEGQWVPSPNEEYFIYQTLLGIWPLRFGSEGEKTFFKGRVEEYLLKAIRESKVNSSWISPNRPYEEALMKFVEALLSPSADNPFLKDFDFIQQKISYWGMFNSLSQTLLKITCPGTPDFYQGTEIWDFSLVDPDNRRPVDFEPRVEMLKALKGEIETDQEDLSALSQGLLKNWKDGRIKLYVTFQALNFRRKNHHLFADGDYLPLTGEGNGKRNICAFARQSEDKAVLVAVPRFLTHIVPGLNALPLGKVWDGSWIMIPEGVPGHEFHNIFTGETAHPVEREGKRVLPLPEVFANFPLALLEVS